MSKVLMRSGRCSAPLRRLMKAPHPPKSTSIHSSATTALAPIRQSISSTTSPHITSIIVVAVVVLVIISTIGITLSITSH